MIYVRIELWPGGHKDHPRAQVIGEAFISNTGTSKSATTGNYHYELTGKKGSKMGAGAVIGFPRKRKMAWDLLKIILNDARRD